MVNSPKARDSGAKLAPELAKRVKTIMEGTLAGHDLFLLLNVRARTASQADLTRGVDKPADEVIAEFRTVNTAYGQNTSEVTFIYHHGVSGAKARSLVKKAASLLRSIKGDLGLSDSTPVSIRLSETGGIRTSKLASVDNGAPFPEIVPHKAVLGILKGGSLPTLKQLAGLSTKAF